MPCALLRQAYPLSGLHVHFYLLDMNSAHLAGGNRQTEM